jgi:hypothetical protein
MWKRVTIYPNDTKAGRAAAKRNKCSWDKIAREWYIEHTNTHASQLSSWHVKKLEPPPVLTLKVAYKEHEMAKSHGARWDAERKVWTLRARLPNVNEWLRQRVVG